MQIVKRYVRVDNGFIFQIQDVDGFLYPNNTVVWGGAVLFGGDN